VDRRAQHAVAQARARVEVRGEECLLRGRREPGVDFRDGVRDGAPEAEHFLEALRGVDENVDVRLGWLARGLERAEGTRGEAVGARGGRDDLPAGAGWVRRAGHRHGRGGGRGSARRGQLPAGQGRGTQQPHCVSSRRHRVSRGSSVPVDWKRYQSKWDDYTTRAFPMSKAIPPAPSAAGFTRRQTFD